MKEADDQFEKQLDTNKSIEDNIELKEIKSEELAQKILETEGEFLKQKDNPVRIEKNNEGIRQGVNHIDQKIKEAEDKKKDKENEKKRLED